MSAPRGIKPFLPSSRAQSSLLGVVLLIGMVATASLGLFFVASDAITSAEQQSEQERIEQAFVDLGHSMASVSSSSDSSQSMNFDAGEHGAITQREAGNITINSTSISESSEYGAGEGDGTGEPLVIPIGSIEYDDGEGAPMAYQAGGVWHGTGAETRMVSAPPLSYKDETLNLPVTTVSDDQTLESGDIRMSYQNTDSTGAIPIENETITMTIYTDYTNGWKTYFESQVSDAVVTGLEHEGDDSHVEVMLTDLDAEGAFDEGFTVSGPASEDGGTDNIDGNIRTGTMPELDEIIYEMISEDNENNVNTTDNRTWANNPENGPWVIGEDEVDNEFSDGMYFAEEINIHNSDNITFDLESGNATVVVDGDVTIDGSLIVDGDHELRIYATGNFEHDGEVVTTGDSNPEQIQVYGTSTMSVGFTGETFEGLLYAPSSDFDGPNEIVGGQCGDHQVCSQNNPTINGSIVAHSIHFQGGANNVFNYDLEDPDIDIEPDGYSFPPKITYLNIAEHEINIDQN